MEENRLTTMPRDYDPKLFEKLYKALTPLKRKLASQIDYRKFGCEYKDILSFFDVKFIFVFNKYQDQFDEEVLKGHIIKSLSLYKNRIMRVSYQAKYSQDILDLGSLENGDNLLEDDSVPKESPYIEEYGFKCEILYNFMKAHLSLKAFQLFTINMNPPLYIKHRIPDGKKRIPEELIMEYLDIEAKTEYSQLKKEVRLAIDLAKKNLSPNNE